MKLCRTGVYDLELTAICLFISTLITEVYVYVLNGISKNRSLPTLPHLLLEKERHNKNSTTRSNAFLI